MSVDGKSDSRREHRPKGTCAGERGARPKHLSEGIRIEVDRRNIADWLEARGPRTAARSSTPDQCRNGILRDLTTFQPDARRERKEGCIVSSSRLRCPPMSDADEPKAGEKEESPEKDAPAGKDEAPHADEHEDETHDQDDEEPESDRAAKASSAASQTSAKTKPATSPGGMLALVAAAALAVGGLGGWFGHKAQQNAELRRESMPAGSGSAAVSGPCGAWQQKICANLGEHSAPCDEAKNATDLLTTSTCETALQTMPATLAKVKAARAVCDKLVSKLCADLPPGSRTCEMVKDRTPSFPPSRCEQMMTNYSAVISQLKMMDQQGSMMGGGHPPMGGPPGVQLGHGPTMQMGHPPSGGPTSSPSPAPPAPPH